jgi:tetratricopeptide (TPR) repeat protein
VADWVAVAEIVYQAVRRLRDVRGTVKGLVNLGAALIEAGRFEEAARNLNTALLAGRINFDSLDIDGRILDDVGLALQELGDFEGALWRHNYATELFQELGDRRSEAAARNNAGIVLERLGAHVQAIEAHSAAVETFRGIGDRLGEAMALGNLAIALRGFGNRGEAIDVFAAARTAFEECGDRRSVGQTWRNVGVIDHEAGWLADAVTAFVAAALIFEKIGDWRSGTQMWREVERIYTAAGRPDDARFAAERAMPETEANGLEDRILGVEGWRIHTIYWGEFG